MKKKKEISKDRKSEHIDWNEVRRKVDEAGISARQQLQPAEEEKGNILRTRAKSLAVAAEKEAHEGERLEVVEFVLAFERYAIESGYIREIRPLTELTPLPCTPPFVLGIINARGEILSVIDIKKFFDLPEKGLTDLNKVIVLRSAEMEFGILADSILGIRHLRVNEIEASLPTLTGIREEYLKGITGDRTVILDAAKLLADKNLVVDEEIRS